MEVRQLAPGLWRWTGLHPEWKEGDEWPQAVGSVYYETPETIVLIDPLVPPEDEERFWRALDRDVEGRPVVVLLTVEWHRRSTDEIVGRYGARVGGSVPGVEPFPVAPVDETLWWIPDHGALVAGDILVAGPRVADECLPGRSTPDEIRTLLRPLLELPIERVLVSHGEPVLENGRAALGAALAA